MSAYHPFINGGTGVCAKGDCEEPIDHPNHQREQASPMTDNIEEARATAQDLTKIHPNMLSRQALKETAVLLDRLAAELELLRGMVTEVAGTVPVPEDFARDLSTVLSRAGAHTFARNLDAIPPRPTVLFNLPPLDKQQAAARITRKQN